MQDFIPVNEPLLDGNEKKYLNECIDTGWISSEGPFVKRFEDELSASVNRKFGIAVSNGSTALEVAVAALGISEGDEVIMPTFTIISCATAILRNGAVPVLVDSEPDTWNMDPGQIESKISKKTKAIMVVHIYGMPVDMDPIIAIAKKYKLKIIEDAAEAIGQTYKGNPCGSFGDISTFSFYPNKHITTGEGGMVLTDDPILAEKCYSLRNLCFQKEQRFLHEDLGWNFRMSNLQAAVGVAQLEKLEEHIEKKRKIGKLYNSLLKDTKGIQLPLSSTQFASNIYWIYGIILDDNIPVNAKEICTRLAKKGIGTRPFFWCMHEQPVFMKKTLFKGESYPNAEKMARRGFYLPSGLNLTDDTVHRVSSIFKRIISEI